MGRELKVFCFSFTTTTVALCAMALNTGCGQVKPASVDGGRDGQFIDASVLANDASTSVPDAGIPDGGAPDAGVAPYDVVYGIDWKIVDGDITAGGQGIFTGWLVLVNTGVIGIPMSSLRVISVEDDHPTAAVSLIAHPISEVLPGGMAAGMLIPVAQSIVTDDELLPEPIENFGGSPPNLMTLTVSAPAGVYSFTATAVIEFDGVQKTLDFNIERTPLPVTWYQPVLFDRR